VKTAGFSAPYPYLWSLPAHVLDHRFHRLTTLLDSPNGPSWVVVRGTEPTRLMRRLGPGAALNQHYRMVAFLCGRQVYLRKDLLRGTPQLTEKCSQPLASWNDDSATTRWVATEGRTR